MESVGKQIYNFVQKCEEVKNCKFIMATAKMQDLLKAIVNSGELYELFSTVSANFNYPSAKQKCFIEGARARVILPETIGDRLAFIFCLLVEFDHGDINFNAFLQKYFPKDGSFYSSYHLFCDEIIGVLEGIVCDIYAAELSKYMNPAADGGATAAGGYTDINAVIIMLESERATVSSANISADDKAAADDILVALERAVKAGDAAYVRALTCGYNYFVLYTGVCGPNLKELFDELAALA